MNRCWLYTVSKSTKWRGRLTGWDAIQGFPLRKLPGVPLVIRSRGGYEVEHDRETIARNDAEKEANAKWVKDHGIGYLEKTVHCSKCQHPFDAKTNCSGPHDHCFLTACPNCGTGYKVEWVFKSGNFSERPEE